MGKNEKLLKTINELITQHDQLKNVKPFLTLGDPSKRQTVITGIEDIAYLPTPDNPRYIIPVLNVRKSPRFSPGGQREARFSHIISNAFGAVCIPQILLNGKRYIIASRWERTALYHYDFQWSMELPRGLVDDKKDVGINVLKKKLPALFEVTEGTVESHCGGTILQDSGSSSITYEVWSFLFRAKNNIKTPQEMLTYLTENNKHPKHVINGEFVPQILEPWEVHHYVLNGGDKNPWMFRDSHSMNAWLLMYTKQLLGPQECFQKPK